MRIVQYKADKLVGQGIGCVFLATGAAWVAFQPWIGWEWRLFGGFLALTLPFAAVALFMRWKSGNAALSFNSRELHISTFYRSVNVYWPQVRNIERETLTQTSGFGLIKQDLGHYIVITTADADGSYEVYRVQEELLDLPENDIAQLVQELGSCWVNALDSGQKMQADPVAPRLNGIPLEPARPAFGRKMA